MKLKVDADTNLFSFLMPWVLLYFFWRSQVTFKSFLKVALQNSMFDSIHELSFARIHSSHATVIQHRYKIEKTPFTLLDTLPETNIAPENRPSQNDTSIPTIHFQVLC